MENTNNKAHISPIIVIVVIALLLHLVMVVGVIENWISLGSFLGLLIVIYGSALLVCALISQVDTWLTRYEQNRYASQLKRIQTDDILFEQVLKKETYKGFKQAYLNDTQRREALVKMIAKMKSEFEEGIRAEAKVIVEKERKTQTDNSISPVESFLDKQNEPKTSIARAAKIF